FHGRYQFEVVLQAAGGRHEYIKSAVARLGAHRGAGDPGGGLLGARRLLRVREADASAALATGLDRVGARLRALLALAQLPAQLRMARQRLRRCHRIRLVRIRILALRDPGLRVEWQPITDGRVAWNE